MSTAREVSPVISAENLDARSRDAFVDRSHGIGEYQRASVGKVVAIHRREDEILPTQIADGFGDAQRLEPIDVASWITGFDVAKAAAARAKIAQNHDRCGARAPALGHVRTGGFFTNGVKREAIDLSLDAFVLFADRQRDPQPVRPPCHAELVGCHPELVGCHPELVEGGLANQIDRDRHTIPPRAERTPPRTCAPALREARA